MNAGDTALAGLFNFSSKGALQKCQLQGAVKAAFFPVQNGNFKNDVVFGGPIRHEIQPNAFQKLDEVFGPFPWQNYVARIDAMYQCIGIRFLCSL